MTDERANDNRMADEAHAKASLYGSHTRGQDVTPLGPDHPPTVTSDDAPAGNGRVV
jgi:hypothetical protein